MGNNTKRIAGQEATAPVDWEIVKLMLIPRLNLYFALNFIIIRYFHLLTKFL
jgi:hypothetical protein